MAKHPSIVYNNSNTKWVEVATLNSGHIIYVSPDGSLAVGRLSLLPHEMIGGTSWLCLESKCTIFRDSKQIGIKVYAYGPLKPHIIANLSDAEKLQDLGLKFKIESNMSKLIDDISTIVNFIDLD